MLSISFFKRGLLRKEITTVVVVKIAAIFVLWGLFFSGENRVKMDTVGLENRFLGSGSQKA